MRYGDHHIFFVAAFTVLSVIAIKRFSTGKTTKVKLKVETQISTLPTSASIAAPSPAELAASGFKYPELHRITCEQLKEIMYKSNKPPIIIDTRHPQLFELISMPTALNMPENPEDEQKRMLLNLPHDRPIVFYCGCNDDGEAAKTADRILKLNAGFKKENILILWKGWTRWHELGYGYVCHTVLRDI